MSGPKASVAGPGPSGSLFGRSRADVAAALPDREPVSCPLCQRPPVSFALDFQGLSLSRCRSCGLELHSPRPVLEQMATAVYGEHYHRPEEATAGAFHDRHYGHQLDRLERCVPPERRRLLDVGCGAGAFRDASEPRCVQTEQVGETGGADLGEASAADATDAIADCSLVVFDRGDEIVIQAGEEGVRFLLVSGQPIEEPVAWRGPIVMNTTEQLQQAYAELRAGTFIK